MLKQSKQQRHTVELGDSEKKLSVTKIIDSELSEKGTSVDKETYLIEVEYQSITVPVDLFKKLLNFPKVFESDGGKPK